MIKFYKIQRRVPGTDTFSWYPALARSGTMTVKEITKDIMGRCTLTEVDIVACLKAFQVSVINALQNGYSVKLDDLGTFKPYVKAGIWSAETGSYVSGGRKVPSTLLNADGTVKTMGVSSKDIRRVMVRYFPSREILDALLVDNLSFSFSNVMRPCATAPVYPGDPLDKPNTGEIVPAPPKPSS